MAEKGAKVEELLRGQARQAEELRAQLADARGEVAAAAQRRTLTDVQLGQMRDTYYQNVEQLTSRARYLWSLLDGAWWAGLCTSRLTSLR